MCFNSYSKQKSNVADEEIKENGKKSFAKFLPFDLALLSDSLTGVHILIINFKF